METRETFMICHFDGSHLSNTLVQKPKCFVMQIDNVLKSFGAQQIVLVAAL